MGTNAAKLWYHGSMTEPLERSVHKKNHGSFISLQEIVHGHATRGDSFEFCRELAVPASDTNSFILSSFLSLSLSLSCAVTPMMHE